MGAVEHIRPSAQDVDEAWNAFRVIVRQGLADDALWQSSTWLARYAAAEQRFTDLFGRWCGSVPGRARS